ncbi:MAG: hypothetical protein JWM76_2330 [Pseudonocardiales bacterium]|nr:hypothetical protein [Pseudonocardiales bacterium]
MSLKYFTNLTLAVAGGFLVVASRTFTASTAGWLALGIGVLAVILGTAGLAISRINPRAAGYGVTAALGIWTLVAGLTFTGATQGWLVFANGVALVAVALAELTVHVVRTERVVHTLDVREHSTVQPV